MKILKLEKILEHYKKKKSMYIDVSELTPGNKRPKADCYSCLGCPHLIAINVDSSHEAYIKCSIDIEDVFKL